MPASEITEKCGVPDSNEKIEVPIRARRPNGSTYQVGVSVMEYWTYDRGPTHFPVLVTIEEGTAKGIELLSRFSDLGPSE